MEIEMKRCTRCEKEFPKTTLFFSRRRSKGFLVGWTPVCKMCRCEVTKAQKKERGVEVDRLVSGSGYTVSAKLRTQPYTEAVVNALNADPQRSNRWVANETGAPYAYVTNIRYVLEDRGDIEFVTEWLTENGDWRRRLIRKDRAEDPYGNLDIVYFIREAGNPESLIKIGTTNNMKKRLAAYVLNSPVDIEVIHAVMGGHSYEADLHLYFKDLNVRGEWFRPDPALLDFIEELKLMQPELTHCDNKKVMQAHAHEGYQPDKNKIRKRSCRSKRNRVHSQIENPVGDFFAADAIQDSSDTHESDAA